jgi:hypothetical protein
MIWIQRNKAKAGSPLRSAPALHGCRFSAVAWNAMVPKWLSTGIKIFRSHWFGVLFLVPGLIMVLLHDLLHVSNALLLPRPDHPEDLYLRDYNLIMVIALYYGSGAFFFHTLMAAKRSARILWMKFAALTGYWVIVTLVQ